MQFLVHFRALSFLYPFGATLNVMKPAAAVLSTGSVSFPLNRPVCGFHTHKVCLINFLITCLLVDWCVLEILRSLHDGNFLGVCWIYICKKYHIHTLKIIQSMSVLNTCQPWVLWVCTSVENSTIKNNSTRIIIIILDVLYYAIPSSCLRREPGVPVHSGWRVDSMTVPLLAFFGEGLLKFPWKKSG